MFPGTPVWVQHRQNARWKPATIVKQADAPYSNWIICTNGAGQHKLYRRTCTVLKIRSKPTDDESKSQMEEQRPELVDNQFQF